MHTYLCTYLHLQTRAYTYTQTYTPILTHTRTYAQAHARTHAHCQPEYSWLDTTIIWDIASIFKQAKESSKKRVKTTQFFLSVVYIYSLFTEAGRCAANCAAAPAAHLKNRRRRREFLKKTHRRRRRSAGLSTKIQRRAQPFLFHFHCLTLDFLWASIFPENYWISMR